MTYKMTRREAISTGFLTLSALATMAYPTIKKYNISVQLYSVRDEMQKNPLTTLEKISQIGFRHIEPANYVNQKVYGYGATEFRKITDDLGLEVNTSHTPFKKTDWNISTKDLTDSFKKTIDDALIMGQKILIVPSFDWDKTNWDQVKKGIEAFVGMAEIAKQAGLRIGYHNHDQEFTQTFNGEPLYDLMMKEWNPLTICQQLDVANMAIAGVDPMTYLRKYPHHFESLHVKDLVKATSKSTRLGDGDLNLDAILAFARKNTTIQYWVLEQEDYGNQTPLDCMEYNLSRFKRYGFI